MTSYICLTSFNILVATGIYFSAMVKRRPSVLELALASLILYSSPLIFNSLTLTNYDFSYQIHPLSFVVMVIPIALITLFLATSYYSPEELPVKINNATNIERYSLFIGFFILTVVILTNIIDVWPLDKFQSKPEINRKVTNPFSLFLRNFLLSFCMAFAVVRKKYLMICILLMYGIIIASIFQTRSAFIFSVIVLTIISLQRADISRQRAKLITALSAVVLFLVAVFYKSIKGRLLQGAFDRINSPFSGDVWLNIFENFEPQSTTSLLNGAIEQNYTPPDNHFLGELLRAIPFSQKIFTNTQSKWGQSVQDAIFPDHQHGWASNIWGEFYSLFGLGGLFTWAIVWVLGIVVLDKLIRSKSIFSIAWAATLIPQWAFFITRVPLGSNLSYLLNTSTMILCIYSTAYILDRVIKYLNDKFTV